MAAEGRYVPHARDVLLCGCCLQLGGACKLGSQTQGVYRPTKGITAPHMRADGLLAATALLTLCWRPLASQEVQHRGGR
jgi:hypothetical protein